MRQNAEDLTCHRNPPKGFGGPYLKPLSVKSCIRSTLSWTAKQSFLDVFAKYTTVLQSTVISLCSFCLQSCHSSKRSTPVTTCGAHTPPWFSWSCWKSTTVPTLITPSDFCTKDRREPSPTVALHHARWLSSANTSRRLFHRTLKQIAR